MPAEVMPASIVQAGPRPGTPAWGKARDTAARHRPMAAAERLGFGSSASSACTICIGSGDVSLRRHSVVYGFTTQQLMLNAEGARVVAKVARDASQIE